ncbi:MAG: creatininase family protein [Bdellovibrionales bacterium]|nr:creatininase family protein [Oligoflexia bacterium]
MIASLSFMSSQEIKVLLPELTLFLFPFGGPESHGTQLPLGTKLMQAEAYANELAQNLQTKLPLWNFILMPLIPLSVDSITNQFTLNVRPHVVRDALVDQCEQLKRLGFQNFTAVSAQLSPRQLTALEDAGKIVSRNKIFGGKKAQLVSVMGLLVDAKAVWDSPMIALPKEHAGAFDTGLMLKWNPGLVGEGASALPSIPQPKPSFSRFIAYCKNELDGYWGRPADASVASASVEMSRDIESIALKMVPWLEQGKGQGIFKSAYRYFPMNGSFFKAYLLAILFFFVMLLWVIWGVKDAFEV